MVYQVEIHKDPDGGYVGVCNDPNIIITGKDEIELQYRLLDAVMGYYEAFPEELTKQFEFIYK